MEQGQDLGRAAADVFVRLLGRVFARLPGWARMRHGLKRPRLVLAPDRQPKLSAQRVGLLDQLFLAKASGSLTRTTVARGAWGLLLKEHALDTLTECLKTVAAGQRWLPEELVAPAIRRAAERRATVGQLERVLTAREYEIAGLIAQGLSNKHIARALAISEGTVKIHLHNMYEKLGGVNRTSLAVLMQNAQGPRRTLAG